MPNQESNLATGSKVEHTNGKVNSRSLCEGRGAEYSSKAILKCGDSLGYTLIYIDGTYCMSIDKVL